MTKDILKLSATFLGLEDVVLFLTKPSSEISDEVDKKLNDLIAILNYVLRNITKEYFPLNHEEVLTSNNQCEVYFNTFEYNPISINDVKNSLLDSVTYNIYPEYLKVGKPNNNYLIKYNYVPKKIVNIDDSLVLPLGLEPFTVCYGIASEYALSKLLYSEAEMWESKFKNSLETYRSIKGERRFHSRRLK